MTTATRALTFPSVEWFRALAAAAATDEARYHKLGVVDLTLGVQVGDDGYRLDFADFGCTSVNAWDGIAPVDCVIRASADDWRELIEHVQERGAADSRHTLNSLVLTGDRFVLEGDDQLGVDAFYRFNATLQAFVEEAGGIPTRFV